MEEKRKPYGTVLIRASKILDYLSEEGDCSCLKDIAKATDMTTSTTLKILDTLLLIGYVRREEETKEYSLGPSLIRYANKYLNDSVLVEAAMPYLEKLHDEVDETIHLGIHQGDEVMYLKKFEPKNQSIYMSSKVGMTRPLYSSAMGKTILATFDDKQLTNYLATTNLVAYTENTMTNPFAIRKEVALIKETGIGYDDEEMEKDCFCIGANINLGGGQYGAFSISMLKIRVTPKLEDRLIRLIKETKTNIEQALITNGGH